MRPRVGATPITDGLPSEVRPRTLVIYAGDAGYAYPMLASARSVRTHSGDDFDIQIFATDYSNEQFDRTAAIAETFKVKVAPLRSAEYTRFDMARYNPDRLFAHLKPSVLSRLVTGRAIPEHYDQILYLDGDTLCVGDLRPLINFRAPGGRLLGVADSANQFKLDEGPYGAGWRAFMGQLGLSVDDTWYNTGVMMADRQTWIERGDAALDYFIDNIDICKFPVDSSTNATARDFWSPISCRWNFMAPMRMWGLDAAINPRFYHFTGSEKPWLGLMDPWRDFWPRYEAIRKERLLADIAPPYASKAQVAAANRRRAIGRLKDSTLLAHRVRRARRGVLAREKAALI
jgi:lipopolysaccharide biosynthesis glycosyltransferase